MLRRSVSFAVVLVILGSTPLLAQVKQFQEWNNQCTPGSLQACASVALALEYNATLSRTAMVLRVVNHQGSADWPPTMGAFGIDGLSFEYMSHIPSPPWRTDPINGVVYAGTVEGNASHGTRPGSSDVPVEEGDMSGLEWNVNNPDLPGWFGIGRLPGFTIGGCDRPEGLLTRDGAHTCGGALVYRADVNGRLEFTDQSRLTIRAVSYEGAGVERCTTGVDCVVVPEPTTWILMATGLLGLGIVARRRRGPAEA